MAPPFCVCGCDRRLVEHFFYFKLTFIYTHPSEIDSNSVGHTHTLMRPHLTY